MTPMYQPRYIWCMEATTAAAPTTAELIAWLARQDWSDFATSLARQAARKPLSAAQDAAARRMYAKCAVKVVAAPVVEVTPGIHLAGEHIVKVVAPKNGGRPYIMGLAKFNADAVRREIARNGEHTGRWVYMGRTGLDQLGAGSLLTWEQALAFGQTEGWCVDCDRHLEDPTSAFDGIGPACAKARTGMTVVQARKAGFLRPLPVEVVAATKAFRAARKGA